MTRLPFRLPASIALLFGVVLAAGAAGGILAAIASPASLTFGKAPRDGPPVYITPSPAASPTVVPTSSPPPPAPTQPGQLGDHPRLLVAGSAGGRVLFALGGPVPMMSGDGGMTWSQVALPPGGLGLAVDPRDPKHLITGGPEIKQSRDRGATWSSTAAHPPPEGPYLPLLISLHDQDVWFLVHQGHLLRTRDGGVSWIDLPNLPSLSDPVLESDGAQKRFMLGAGTRVFELSDNGQEIAERHPLPARVVELAGAPNSLTELFLARTAENRVYRDGPTSWQDSGTDLGGPLLTLGDDRAWIGNGGAKLGQPGTLALTTNHGVVWIVASGLPRDQTVEAITAEPPGQNLFAYCYGGDLYGSADGGRSWHLVSISLRHV